jgi:hypothetical protein
MEQYDYLTVDCKGPECDKLIFLYCMGRHERFVGRLTASIGTETFEARCSNGHLFQYKFAEVQARIGPVPTAEFVPHPAFGEIAENRE